MRRFLSSIDRWGPAVVSVLSLFVVCGIAWTYSERIAKLEGIVYTQQQQLNLCTQIDETRRAEIAGINKWIIAVWSKLDAAGINLPLPSKENKKDVN